MSNYQDIYSDLPSRVFRVWQRTKAGTQNTSEDLTVTAMLMAATAGFAMPLEVLKDAGVGTRFDWNDHPAFRSTDQSAYQKALTNCNVFFKQTLDQCCYLNGMYALQCERLADVRDNAEYPANEAMIELSTRDVRWVVRILRNALAHNNIVTFGKSVNHIERLAFFSENRIRHGCKSQQQGWHVLAMPVQTFEKFLIAWFELLTPPDSFAAAAAAIADSAEPR